MAIILPNSVFLHIPKTGGTWVTEVIKKLGLYRNELLATHQEPHFLLNSNHNVPVMNFEFMCRPFRFCFVRNPLTWYRSYWVFHNSIKWNHENTISKLNDSKFENFIKNVVKRNKRLKYGFLGALYDEFTKYCTFVGKQETLKNDFVKAMTLFKEDIREKIIRNHVSVNLYCNKDIAKEAVYTKKMQEDIIETENDCFENYNYEKKIIKDFRKQYNNETHNLPEKIKKETISKGYINE